MFHQILYEITDQSGFRIQKLYKTIWINRGLTFFSDFYKIQDQWIAPCRPILAVQSPTSS